jgi:carboxyl-terminal processing protease
MTVLTSEYTASASEIFAGAIRDYDYGTLIGTKTFGKGIVQSTINLPDGSAMKLTTARYFTPKGECIHEVGIEPDIKLEYEFMGNADAEYDELQDNQIQKAIEVLKNDISNK